VRPDTLRPRSATGIVDFALQLLRAHYSRVVALAVIVMLPYIAITLLNVEKLADARQLFSGRWHTFAVVAAVRLVIFVIADAALILALSEAYLEGRMSVSAALGRTASRSGPVLAGGALRLGLSALFALPAVLAVVVPLTLRPMHGFGPGTVLVWAAVMWALIACSLAYPTVRTLAVTPAIVLEGLGPIAALRRSFALTRRQTRHALAALIMAWLIYVSVIVLSSLIGTLLRQPTAALALQTVVVAATYPLLASVETVLYYDLRVRTEGFDVELMARDASLAPAS